MKTYLFIGLFILGVASANAQVGINTTSPNSTLDVRGSMSLSYRAFSSGNAVGATDNVLLFTGTSAATLTLPDATACTGREYWIKNTSSNISLLTVATTSAQTIDGLSNWLLDESNETVRLISNGTNWNVTAQSLPTGSGTSWSFGGNSVPSLKTIGTLNNFDFPFITNNSEKMRLSASGNLGLGTSSFNGTYPEKLLVDAGTTSSVNAIVGKGSINNYLQLNIQNMSNGGSASSDVVATADNGSETTNFVDMGINGSNNNGGIMGVANDAYLYNIGQNFLLGTGTTAKSLVFMTGGTTQSSNERMRIDGSGNVGIGINNPSYKLQVFSSSNPLYLAGVQTGASSDSLLTIINGVVRKISPVTGTAWTLAGNAGTSPITNFLGTTDNQAFVVKVFNTQVGRFDVNSIALGIGATANNSTHSYAFGSNAAIGYNHTNAFAIGNSAANNTDNSFAIGNSAVVNGSNSFAIGNNAAANNTNSLAIGSAATTAYSITDAIAIGANATVTNSNAIAIGSHSTAANKTIGNASNAIAIGVTAVSNSASSIAIGTNSTTAFSIAPAIALGNSATANGASAIAIGNGASVGSFANSIAIGASASTSVSATNSTALGYNASATQANEIILGDRANTALSVGIGSEGFSGSNKEKLLVDAGANASGNFQNVIVGKGNTNSYAQLNIQNINGGTGASSDVVATADNGSETTNFVDMGINSSTNNAGIMGGINDSYLYNIGQNFLLGTGSGSKSLIFLTGGTSQSTNERMRIDGSGNVGIGTTSPAQKFHVSGGNVRISNNGINEDIMIGTSFAGITNATGIAYYEISGAETHMFGGQIIPDADNTWTCGSSARRWSTVYSANGVVTTSDMRLKKNIHDLPYGLKDIIKLRPVGYNWKNNTGGDKIGLIAQEVRKVIPEVVLGDESKENLGVNYADLIPVLINAIKEQEQHAKGQQDQIDQLKKEIELLKAKK